MATNTINNINDAAAVLARAAAETLRDNLQFCSNIDRADNKDFEGKNGYKAGDTIKTSIPPRYIAQEDDFDITSSIQNSVETTTSLTLDISSTVGMEFDTTELATEVGAKSIAKRFVMPAAETIAQNIEQRFIEKATDATYNLVGTAGSTSFSVADVLAGRVKLNQMLAPKGNYRNFLLNSEAGAAAVDARKGLFQSASEIEKQYKNGMVGRSDGFDWYENELINVHTNGTDVTGVAVNGTISEGASSVTVDGLTATTGTVTKGSVFTIAGVYKVHPITKTSYGVLQQFVVTANATADASGEATVSISPTIYTATSKGLQNVDALPADDAALVFSGAASTAYTQNLQFHKSAFKMVSVPLEMPQNAEFAAMETVDGITVAVVRDFDILKRRYITRLDFLGGLEAVRPEWACRVTS